MERKVVPIMFENCIPQLLQSYLKVIPDPKLHDPEELPIPPDEEYQTMKTHTTLGYKMCMKDPKLRKYAARSLLSS